MHIVVLLEQAGWAGSRQAGPGPGACTDPLPLPSPGSLHRLPDPSFLMRDLTGCSAERILRRTQQPWSQPCGCAGAAGETGCKYLSS